LTFEPRKPPLPTILITFTGFAPLVASFATIATFAATFAGTVAAAQDVKPSTSLTADLGYVSASGNTNLTTLSIGEKIVHTDGRWMLGQLAAYIYGKTEGKESANQLRLAARADFAFRPRLGVFAGVAYERNTFAGFNSRTDEIVGLLWKAIVAPRDSLHLEAGGVFTQESDVDGTSQSYPSARIAANYKHVFSKTAYFQQLAEYVPNLQTSGAYRVNSESALVAPVSVHLGVKMSYAVRYNSRPPVKFGSTDRVLTTGVQLSF
jgi:putative salt-induced outer membrane protein